MSVAGTFHQRGFAFVSDPLLPQEVDETLDYLKACPVYPGRHVRQGAEGPRSWNWCEGLPVLCWHHGDALAAPHLLPMALSHTDEAAEILGVETPLLYSVNVFCTRPGGPLRPDIQDWHRDADDTRFVPLFVALTDGLEQEVRGEFGVSSIKAKAGEAFFSNTMLEHRGLVPDRERIIFWARWGVSDPPASYGWDQLHPVPASDIRGNYPDDPRLRESLKLLVMP